MNEKNYKNYDLLNTYIKFNYKCFKINEIKLYINNIYICKIGYFSYYIYKKIYDVNYKEIKKINDLNLDNIEIEQYNYDEIKDALKIKIYSKLYVSNKTIHNPILNKVINISPDEILSKKETSYTMNNQSSTILDDEQLNVLNWLNN